MKPEHHGVIFDMDGILIDSEPLFRMAAQQAATAIGHTCLLYTSDAADE